MTDEKCPKCGNEMVGPDEDGDWYCKCCDWASVAQMYEIDIARLQDQLAAANAILGPLERLRNCQEGAFVVAGCSNPSFDPPAEKIVVACDWSGRWREREFTGETLTEALAAAEKAKEQSDV